MTRPTRFAVPTDGPITVYVPATHSMGIHPGSGIVGTETGTPDGATEPLLRLDYEGDIHGTTEGTYADLVERALGRHRWNDGLGYPTVARMTVPRSTVVPVGHYDPECGEVVLDDPARLAAWLGVPVVAEAQLHSSGMRHQQRRAIEAAARSDDPRLREAARQEARRLDARKPRGR